MTAGLAVTKSSLYNAGTTGATAAAAAAASAGTKATTAAAAAAAAGQVTAKRMKMPWSKSNMPSTKNPFPCVR